MINHIYLVFYLCLCSFIHVYPVIHLFSKYLLVTHDLFNPLLDVCDVVTIENRYRLSFLWHSLLSGICITE